MGFDISRQISVIDGPKFDYIQHGRPTISVNPKVQYATWLNVDDGEMFICLDAAHGLNVWQGQSGTRIAYYAFPSSSIKSSFSYTELGGTTTGAGCYLVEGELPRMMVATSNTDNIILFDDAFGTNGAQAASSSYPTGVSQLGESGVVFIDSYSAGSAYIYNSLFSDYVTRVWFGRDAKAVCSINGDIVYSAGGTTIYRCVGVSTDVKESIVAPITASHLEFDGTNLIIASGAEIHIMDGFSDTSLKQIVSPATIEGIFFNGKNLCAVANAIGYIFANEDEL